MSNTTFTNEIKNVTIFTMTESAIISVTEWDGFASVQALHTSMEVALGVVRAMPVKCCVLYRSGYKHLGQAVSIAMWRNESGAVMQATAGEVGRSHFEQLFTSEAWQSKYRRQLSGRFTDYTFQPLTRLEMGDLLDAVAHSAQTGIEIPEHRRHSFEGGEYGGANLFLMNGEKLVVPCGREMRLLPRKDFAALYQHFKVKTA